MTEFDAFQVEKTDAGVTHQCTSSDLVEPFDSISKRHFSAGDFSSLTC